MKYLMMCNDMDGIYQTFDEYIQVKNTKILIVFNHIIADVLSKKTNRQ